MTGLFDAIRHYAATQPEIPAIVGELRCLTYGELPEAIQQLAQTLTQRQERIIALRAGNTRAWCLFDLASLAAGITLVPMPTFFTPEQQQHAMRDAGVQTLYSDQPVPDAECLEVADRQFYRQHIAAASVALPEGTAKITYTSGSTGAPKGVCLTQEALEKVAGSLVEALGTELSSRHAATLPLPVLLENVAGLYATLLAGKTYHLLPGEQIGEQGEMPQFLPLVKTLAEKRLSSCILVPELLRGIMAVLAQSGLRLPDMRFIALGGSRVAPELLAQSEALGLPVCQGYGLSEACSVVAVNTPEANRVGSVGKLLPHVAVRIAGDGEIFLKTALFSGYLGEEAIPGEYATGDLGHLDKDGYLFIDGRKKNLLITSYGRNISPEWPESLLLAQPEIAQAVVFGDAEAVLTALLVPSSPQVSRVALETAVARTNKKLPVYAHIGAFHTVPPFRPENGLLTGTGRPRRQAIAAQYAALLQAGNNSWRASA